MASNKQLAELTKFLKITITSILDMNTKARKKPLKSSKKSKAQSIAKVIRDSFSKLKHQAPYKVEFKMINQAAQAEPNSDDKSHHTERNRPHVESDEQFLPVDNYSEHFEENPDESVEYEPH